VSDRSLPPDADAPEQIAWAGDFVVAKQRGRWEYAGRARGLRAAVILAIDSGEVLLVEQYRVPLGRFCLELPAGLIGDETEGEDALTSAQRELEEETGFRPRDLRHVMSFYSSPGFCDELLYLYYTRDVLRTAPNLDLDECLVVEFYSLNDAIEMARRGEILDAKTTAALFWLAHRKMGF